MWTLRYLSVSWCYTGRPTRCCTFKSHSGPSIFNTNQFQQYWPVVDHLQLTKCIDNVQTKFLQDRTDSRPIILTTAQSLFIDEKIMHEGLALYICNFNEFKGIFWSLFWPWRTWESSTDHVQVKSLRSLPSSTLAYWLNLIRCSVKQERPPTKMLILLTI